jgi:hypothetical protein
MRHMTNLEQWPAQPLEVAREALRPAGTDGFESIAESPLGVGSKSRQTRGAQTKVRLE